MADGLIQSIKSPGVGGVLDSPAGVGGKAEKTGGKDFLATLMDSLQEVNQQQKTVDVMATSVATGKSENLHETMLALSQAELSFNLMVQVRNRALEAYQEVMRMQV